MKKRNKIILLSIVSVVLIFYITELVHVRNGMTDGRTYSVPVTVVKNK